MGLTMKDRYAALDLSKLPKSYQDEFDEMSKSTYGFTDEDLNDIFAENFNEMYSLVTSKYPDAIKKGGTLKKVKSGKTKVVKPKELPKVTYNGVTSFVDFRLEEIRELKAPHNVTPFKKCDPELKAKIRGIRAEFGPNVHIPSLDDDKNKPEITLPAGVRKKLTVAEIEQIEDLLSNSDVSNEEIADRLESEFRLSHFQAKKWVSLRKKYESDIKKKYSERTSQKKRARKGEDLVSTRDGKEFDRKNRKNIGKKFFDENGKQWQCVGYNAKLDECIFKDEDGKEISSCLKDMYTSNPVTKREKGNLVDECKETLKEAGYTVKEHKAGTKKVTRSEPRPEKVIIKERVEESFTPIMKDLKGSEEKEKENKAIIDILEEIQGSFTKFMNRISNLADDKKLDALKKINKLLNEIID